MEFPCHCSCFITKNNHGIFERDFEAHWLRIMDRRTHHDNNNNTPVMRDVDILRLWRFRPRVGSGQ